MGARRHGIRTQRIFGGLLIALALATPARPSPARPAGQNAAAPHEIVLPFPKQKALFEKLRVLEAWRLSKGSPDVLVGVIDNGFDFFHPDLKEALLPGFYAPGGFHTEIYDNMAHGTAVASLIAARGGPGSEMIGLAPGCRVLTASLGMIEQKLLKILNELQAKNPKAEMADFQKEMAQHADELKKMAEEWPAYQAASTAASIRYLVDHGVKVINFSGLMRKALIPSAPSWDALQAAFRYAAEKDVLIVSGAGNNAQECDDYPGDPATTLIAGACRLDGTRWEEEREIMGRKIKEGSNFGKRLSVMAPVDDLVVCAPHEARFYAAADGPAGVSKGDFKGVYDLLPIGATSCAAPIVASLAALVRGLRPDLGVPAVVEIVEQGCEDIGEKGRDAFTGHGRIDFLKTLQIANKYSR